MLGGDVPSYNVPGVAADLKFTPEALAGIYLGKITKWNDPADCRTGVKLPAQDIVVVHRSDGAAQPISGLITCRKSAQSGKLKLVPEHSVNGPSDLGGKGNEGVAGLVKQTPNAIGYVELIYAIQNQLPYGTVRNTAGEFVKATLQSVSSAAASAMMPNDFRVSITNPPGKGAYPIASFTWLLVPAQINDAKKREAIKGFLYWMLAEGQQYCEPLFYAKLPTEVIAKEEPAIALIL